MKKEPKPIKKKAESESEEEGGEVPVQAAKPSPKPGKRRHVKVEDLKDTADTLSNLVISSDDD